MRKYLSLITDHPDESFVGRVESSDKPLASVEKNEESAVHKRNVEDNELGEEWIEMHVGLGYADFANQEQYEEDFLEVVLEKLDEVDDDLLEKAGVMEVVSG